MCCMAIGVKQDEKQIRFATLRAGLYFFEDNRNGENDYATSADWSFDTRPNVDNQGTTILPWPGYDQ